MSTASDGAAMSTADSTGWCQTQQRKEISHLRKMYQSFQDTELEGEQHEGQPLHQFQLGMSPFPMSGVKKNLNKIVVLLEVLYPPQYPPDIPHIKVFSLKGLKEWQCRRLERFLQRQGGANRGRLMMGTLLKSAKSWIKDRNQALLSEKEQRHSVTSSEQIEQQLADQQHVVSWLMEFELQGKKKLLSLVASSVIKEHDFFAAMNLQAFYILDQCIKVVYDDPEFLLRLAFHVREELNVRSTANYLVAIASCFRVCHPFFPKYFCSIIRLPSDLLSVVRLYYMLPASVRYLDRPSLPNALRNAIKAKFQQFDMYQLGKYCGESQRKRLLKKAKMGKYHAKRMGTALESYGLPEDLVERRPFVTMKHLIKQMHITEPRDHIMRLLGHKYPKDEEEFAKNKLPGSFDPSLAGKRMKLVIPLTWESQISGDRGNTADLWENLLNQKKLPFMAMLRNLRNLLRTGVSMAHHDMVIEKLTNPETIMHSRQFPFRFLSAHDAVNVNLSALRKLHTIGMKNRKKEKRIEKMNKNFVNMGLIDDAEKKKRGIVVAVRNKNKAKRRVGEGLPIVFPVCMPTKTLIHRYRDAINTAVQVAALHNLPHLEGKTVIVVDQSLSMNQPCTTYNVQKNKQTMGKAALMLGLMLEYAAKDSEFWLFAEKSEKMKVDKSVGIMDNLKLLLQWPRDGAPTNFPWEVLDKLMHRREKINQFVLISDMIVNSGNLKRKDFVNPLVDQIKRYRDIVNSEMLFVSVDLGGTGLSVTDQGPDGNDKDVLVCGFSDKILPYMVERGEGQLNAVEGIDVRKGLVH